VNFERVIYALAVVMDPLMPCSRRRTNRGSATGTNAPGTPGGVLPRDSSPGKKELQWNELGGRENGGGWVGQEVPDVECRELGER